MKKYSCHKINNNLIPSVPSRIRVLGNELSSLIPFSSQFSSFFPHFRDFPAEIQPALINKSWNRAPERVVKISSLEKPALGYLWSKPKEGPYFLMQICNTGGSGLECESWSARLDIELQSSLECLQRDYCALGWRNELIRVRSGNTLLGRVR